MFGRQKRKDRPKITGSTEPMVTAPKEPEAKRPASYAELARERLLTIKDSQAQLIKEALDRGVPEAELPQLLADAMNAGKIPRVVQGLSWRGSGFQLIMFDGKVPSEALTVSVYRAPDGQQIYGTTVELGPAATLEGQGGDNDFSITTTPLLPQTGYDSPDLAVLTMIDSHMTSS